MGLESLSLLQLLAPTLFVIGALYILGPALPLSRTWARFAVFSAVWLMVARYCHWRLFSTVLPAEGAWYELSWIWFCYGVELFALADALILYLIFLRRSDRIAEADRHESRLRAQTPDQLPSVDVYIPTYNESLDVLEKTITGAQCLDYPKFQIWVLDDGRRPWLKEFCGSKGVGYITRENNAHAKAGNINHALTKTNADFVAIFDADFIPQHSFLMRTIGFFEDPKIGIVQVPHTFYNNDPMQTNLGLQKTLPGDQRFFFEAIMPSRDAWDAAFCCGSNSVTRRAAMRAVGDALPTGSITEDMLLTMAMLRYGFITRYLCEPLAFGLAPESLKAFFVQRERWATGATQMLFLREGPLGPNLGFMHRLFFLPTHWLSQSCMMLLTIIAPTVFLLTGMLPLVNVTSEFTLFYILPMLLAMVGGLCAYAPSQYFPLATQVLGTFQSFKLIPVVLLTLVKPHGHAFKVTPKGGSANQATYERGIFQLATALIVLTAAGLTINAIPEWRIIDESASLPVLAIWASINVVVLFLVCMMALQAPANRSEERFKLNEPIWIFGEGGALSTGRIQDVSLSGAAIRADGERAMVTQAGSDVRLFIAEVGFVGGKVIRQHGQSFAVQFTLPPGTERDLLIRKLFTLGLNTIKVEASAISATRAMMASIVTARMRTERRADLDASAGVAEKLAAESLVVQPMLQTQKLADLSVERRSFAA